MRVQGNLRRAPSSWFKNNMGMILRDWQRKSLPLLRSEAFETSAHYLRVTLLAYTFPQDVDGEAFDWIEFAILQSWKKLGQLKTVIVAPKRFAKLDAFVARYSSVEVKISEKLVPGDIKSMSIDCLENLWRYFETPEVLLVQDDGFPIKSNLEDFLGKYDYIGAPIVAVPWKRKLVYALNLATYNGGLTLRSRRYCRYVSYFWRYFLKWIFKLGFKIPGEDVTYCMLSRLNPYAWFRFRFPPEKTAMRFAVDILDGHREMPAEMPFGAHGKATWAHLRQQGLVNE